MTNGLSGAVKTTAPELAAEKAALRLTPGEWMISLFAAANPLQDRRKAPCGPFPAYTRRMRILVDADACPVKDIIREEAARAGRTQVLWFATVDHEQSDTAAWVRVPKGPDAVDHALYGALRPADIVVTQDYGLASLCLGRGVRAIHPDGRIYSEATMPFLLEERYHAAKVRRAGGHTRGPRRRGIAEDAAFRAALRSLLAAGQPPGPGDA